MATSDVLFPSDFERLYNLPFQWADTNLRHAHLRGQEHSALKETDPDRIQRLSEEIGKAMHRSQKHRQERAMASGGDLVTKEGQELGRRLVKKRGEEFASRQTGAPAVPSVPSSEVPFTESETLANEIEVILQQLLNNVETGAIANDISAGANKVLHILLSKGDILTAGQLNNIYSLVREIISVIPAFDTAVVSKEKQAILSSFALTISTIIRAMRMLLAYVNRQPRERKAVMSTLRKEVNKFIRKRTAEGLRASRIPGRPRTYDNFPLQAERLQRPGNLPGDEDARAMEEARRRAPFLQLPGFERGLRGRFGPGFAPIEL